jgi:hypothetical protein
MKEESDELLQPLKVYLIIAHQKVAASEFHHCPPLHPAALES